MDGLVAPLASAVDALTMRSVLPAADGVLTERLLAVHRCVQRLLGVQLALVREIEAGGVARRAGAPSTTAWLRQWLRLTPAAARRLVTLAAALDGAPPVVREALASGLADVDQIQAIVRSLRDLPADAGPAVVDKAADVLVGYAREFSADDIGRLGQRVLWHVDPDSAERAERQALDRAEARASRDRYLSLVPEGPASVRLHGRLGLEAAAIVNAALEPLVRPSAAPPALRTGPVGRPGPASWADPVGAAGPAGPDRTSGTGPVGDRAGATWLVPPGPASGAGPVGPVGAVGAVGDRRGADRARDIRTAGQRRADALVEMCRLALGAGDRPDNGGNRAQVVVTVPFDPLAQRLGIGTVDSGQRLSPTAVRRLACDASLVPAVLGADGQPLDVGRERRLFTAAIRRALVLRDGGCAFPGCDRPPRWCDGHHIRHWADGGPTSLQNAVLLCGFHHRLIHDDRAGWTVRAVPGGRPTFVPPPWIDPAGIPRRDLYHRRE